MSSDDEINERAILGRDYIPDALPRAIREIVVRYGRDWPKTLTTLDLLTRLDSFAKEIRNSIINDKK
jgi:hypothetical protein